jgi:hypothetical protein
MDSEQNRPDQENFGEASLGDAQSSDPPEDPEMVDEDADPDSGPAFDPEQADADEDRDQAEG